MNLDQLIMSKNKLILAAALPLLAACSQAPVVSWTEGPVLDWSACHTIVIDNAKSLKGDWAITFSQITDQMTPVPGSGLDIVPLGGPAFKIVPAEGFQPAGKLTVSYKADPLRRHSWAPEGFSLVTAKDVKPLETHYSFVDAEDGDAAFAATHAPQVEKQYREVQNELPLTGMFPMPKQVKMHRLGMTSLENLPRVDRIVSENHPEGWYRITIERAQMTVEASSEVGVHYAQITLDNIIRNAAQGKVPCMVIEDWPDSQYRGLMLDVARNFTAKDDVLKLIDAMDHLKANVLHLHITDDEGWRLEIPGIPELTEVGAFHDPVNGLYPAYDGTYSRKSNGSGNGYYSREDYIEIIRYAAERHISVVPEYDLPAHSRAAIYAMRAYEKRTGDASMRLEDPEDKSVYRSAQYYNDNVLCVASPSVYAFIEKVFDETIAMYNEAGVELEMIHVGGDEVPEGVWTASPVCSAFMAENGISTPAELRSYFIERVGGIAAERGLKILGWQEVVQGLTPKAKETLYPVVAAVNCWNTLGTNEIFDEVKSLGFGAIYSSAEYVYADQAYSVDRTEPGHQWAHMIDEIRCFEAPIPEGVWGVSTTLFSETIRNFGMVCYYFFPKMVGAYERAWNNNSRLDTDQFLDILYARENPYIYSLLCK